MKKRLFTLSIMLLCFSSIIFSQSISTPYWATTPIQSKAEYNFGTKNNFGIPFFTNNIQRMLLSSTGNLGIGTDSPTEKLDVAGNVRFSGALISNNNAGTVGQVLTSGGGNNSPTWTTLNNLNSWNLTGNTGTNPANNFIGTTDSQRLAIRTNNTEKLTILPNGNIGIGTTTPNKILEIVSPLTNGFTIRNATNTASLTYNIFNSGVDEAIVGNWAPHFTGDIIWYSGIPGTGVERMRLKNTGNLGIGTSTPISTLQVNGSFGSTLLTGLVAGVNNPNLTASKWYYESGTGTITLPPANTTTNVEFVIINRTAGNRTITAYTNLVGNIVTTINRNNSITIQSNGTSYLQIR